MIVIYEFESSLQNSRLKTMKLADSTNSSKTYSTNLTFQVLGLALLKGLTCPKFKDMLFIVNKANKLIALNDQMFSYYKFLNVLFTLIAWIKVSGSFFN